MEDESDHVNSVAKSKALFNMQKVRFCDTIENATAALEGLAAGSVVLFVVDVGGCSTTSIGRHMRNLAALKPANCEVRICVFTGPAFNAASAGEAAITANFSNLGTFAIRLASSQTSAKPSSGGVGRKKVTSSERVKVITEVAILGQVSGSEVREVWEVRQGDEQ